MSLKDLKRVKAKDPDLEKVQENIREYLGQMSAPFLNGVLIETIVSSVGSSIAHGLTRKFQGWFIIDLQGDARVWRDTTSSADLTKFLPLKSSISVNVKLWVF